MQQNLLNKYGIPISTGAAVGSLMYATSGGGPGDNRNMFSRYAPLSYPVIGALAGYKYANMMPQTVNVAPVQNTQLEEKLNLNTEAIKLLLRNATIAVDLEPKVQSGEITGDQAAEQAMQLQTQMKEILKKL